MLVPMKEFDLVSELAMYASTAAGMLVIFAVVSGLVLLVRYLLTSSRLRRPRKL